MPNGILVTHVPLGSSGRHPLQWRLHLTDKPQSRPSVYRRRAIQVDFCQNGRLSNWTTQRLATQHPRYVMRGNEQDTSYETHYQEIGKRGKRGPMADDEQTLVFTTGSPPSIPSSPSTYCILNSRDPNPCRSSPAQDR